MYPGAVRGRCIASVVLGLIACRVSDIDYTGKQCPCPGGYTCQLATQTCAHATGGSDAGAIDAPPDAGLTGLHFWFPLDEKMGLVATDVSGVGGNGTVGTATQWLPGLGKLNGALHIGGAGVGSPGVMIFPGPCKSPIPSWPMTITVAVWLRFDSFQTAPAGGTLGDFAVVQGTSGGTAGDWGVGATDKCGAETIGFEVASTTSVNRTIRCSTTVLTVGTWYHVVAVYDGPGGRLDVFVNGALDNGTLMGTVPSAIPVANACPHVGGPTNAYNFMTGSVDELRVYDGPFDAAEVAVVYHLSGG
jgi:hypothetical protein